MKLKERCSKKAKMSHAVRIKDLLEIYKQIICLLLKAQIFLILTLLVMCKKRRKGGMNNCKMRKEIRNRAGPYIGAQGYLMLERMIKPNQCINCHFGCSQKSNSVRLQVFLSQYSLTTEQQWE
jgi:hypothetical protein